MVDLHCHILPGIDDGAADFSVAGQMLEAAAADGIDTICCTPHFSEEAAGKADRIRAELESRASAVGIQLLPGMEYRYSHVTAADRELQPLGGSSCLLIELGRSRLPASLGELFFALERRGCQIVVAHPERYLTRLDCCAELLRLGVFFQLNADSVLGRNGSSVRSMAERMIESGYCHCVASDAHGGSRTFRLSQCRKRLEVLRGKEFAELVMDRNPRRLLNNLSMETPAPEPESKWKSNWFFRLFSR